ncbi:MAG: aminodeoxychorismate/anthranilate synthase component II [Kangiellaceae bacterium]|nr:aminodeoxychorismate/anthranilate synthase component II [Kangiellaceae bacterium]
MIDNYDSFTFNLVHYLQRLEVDVIVKKNDEIDLAQIAALRPSHIVISPGPGSPNDSGVSLSLINKFYQHIPILGVCLGHQAIGQNFGAMVIKANQVMHGKTSLIQHSNQGVFAGLPKSFNVTRYHSLILDHKIMPNNLEITAWVDQAEDLTPLIMGIKHLKYPVQGVQFHPESVLSENGMQLLENFLSKD